MEFARLKFTHDFTADCRTILDAIHPDRWQSAEPFAFARFADGEHALMTGREYLAKADGWAVDGRKQPHRRIAPALAESLACDLPGWHVGISCRCHHGELHDAYRRSVGAAEDHQTFATIFIFSNYHEFIREFNFSHCHVVSPWAKDDRLRVPVDGITTKWIETGVPRLVGHLCELDRPILLAAGPLSCIIAHEYWQIMHDNPWRQSIIDVGSIFDRAAKGRRTRRYQNPNSRAAKSICVWG